MNIYDEIISEALSLIAPRLLTKYGYDPRRAAREGEKNAVIFKSDTAFELGEGSFPSVSMTALTSNEELVPADEIIVCGDDLEKIGGDCGYARLTFIRVGGSWEHGDEGAYAVIKNLELKKYAVSPEGFMMRPSAFTNREQVRVSKKAVKAGLSFENIGNLLIGKYKENPHVQAVKLVFISLPAVPYDVLDRLADKTVSITKALNHAIADMKMDCHACDWKPVCDEVDGIRQAHGKLIMQEKKKEEET